MIIAAKALSNDMIKIDTYIGYRCLVYEPIYIYYISLWYHLRIYTYTYIYTIRIYLHIEYVEPSMERS